MSGESRDGETSGPDSLSATRAEELDRICDRFEAAWRAGGRPRIEDHLAGAEPPLLSALLRELITIERNWRVRLDERPAPDEYYGRFPGQAEAVAAAFGPGADPLRSPAAAARSAGPAHGLLLALLAFQNNLINRDALLEALRAWAADKATPLGRILLAQGALDAATHSLLEALAAKHLEMHDGDTEKSLAALVLGGSTREVLASVADSDIQATLSRVGVGPGPAGRDTDRTAGYAVSTATGDGRRFRVLRPHAHGGLGAVFVALDSELNREVALKEILDHHADDPTSRQRFLVEAEITGGLEHPGIVPVYGLGTYTGGRPYYAMRFVKGDSLKEAIERFHRDESSRTNPGRRSLELRQLLRRFLDVCNAIDYAHSRGVLHRDIKPGNVIVGRHGETLVVDWGLAKPLGHVEPGASSDERALVPSSASGSAETLPGSALGTPAYMSPEQAAGDLDRLGPRSDVYSLGATLYCLVTGRPPFEGDVFKVLRKVQDGHFAAPRRIDSSIDPALEAICLKAMALKPDDRYVTCRALADDTERWMADEPVSAWRESLPRRARRWARRNRTVVTSLAAAVLVALIGTAVVLAVQTRANRVLTAKNVELDKANRLKDEANAGLLEANERVTRTNAELVSANVREKQRFDLATEAIKLFQGEVADDLVLKADPFKPLRDKLLQSAAEFYGKLERLLEGQTDRSSRTALGAAYFELGELTAKIGNKPAALDVHRKGLAVRRELARDAAAGPQVRGEVATSLHAAAGLLKAIGNADEAIARYEEARNLLEGLPLSGEGSDDRRALLGTVYHATGSVLSATGRTTAALSSYQRSVEILTRLVADRPAVSEFRHSLALTYNTIGAELRKIEKTDEALASYRRALAIWQELANGRGQRQFRTWVAGGLSNIGLLLVETGKRDEAMEAYLRAVAIRQSLADENPAVTDFRRNLAMSLNNIANLLSDIGKNAEAMESYRRALVIYQKLVADDPAVTEFRSYLADVHNNMGVVLGSDGKVTEALESFRRAVTIWEKLANDHPTVPQFQGSLADGLYAIGNALAETGKAEEALVSYRRAVAMFQKLAAENPSVAQYRHYLGDTLASIGFLQAKTGERAESIKANQRAAAIFQKLVDDNPMIPDYRDALARSQTGLADAHFTLGQTALARQAYERAIAIREELVRSNSSVTSYRLNLASSVRRLGGLRLATGDAVGAAAAASKAQALLEALPEHSSQEWIELAYCHAMLAGAAGRKGSGVSATDGEAQAGKAMDLLRRAVAGGYRDSDEMSGNSAFAAIRGRADFRALIMDMAMPAEPFAKVR
jgi:serine/threonine-protein kinase